MKAFAFLLTAFAGLAFLLTLCEPALDAQENKSDDKKTEEKKEEKKKTIARADPQVVVKAKKQTGKIKDVATEGHEITVALIDEKAYLNFKQWQAKTMQDISKTKGDKSGKVTKYKNDLAAEQDKVYAGEELTVSVGETVRVRMKDVPKVFDAEGKEKKQKSDAIAALKSPPLPGYGASFSHLKVGQVVELYLKPTAAAPKTAPAVKKGPIGVDAIGAGGGPGKADVLMVYVIQDVQ